jgi:opacity protein-like surface antigen
MALFRNSGFYLSLGGGTSLPSLELNDRGYEPGFNVHVPIGYHRPNQLLGVRLDLGYNRLGSDRSVVVVNESGQNFVIPANRPQIYSATLNMTARGQLGAFGIYGVGGAGVYQFRSFGINSPIDQALGDGETPVPAFNNGNRIRHNAFGAQIGGGMEFGIGAAALFVESRFVNVFGNTDDFLSRDSGIGSRNAIRWVPVAVGITLR